MTTKNKAPTLAQIRKVAGPLVEVWDDVDCTCYRATAADGWRFDEELHELIAVYGDNIREWKQDCRRDLFDRLAEYRDTINGGTVVEECDDDACEWCHS